MGVWAAVITSVIGTAVPLIAGAVSGGPNYPSPPTMARIPVQQTRSQMQQYESRRMQAGIDAWNQRFPLLRQGGDYLMRDLARNQSGQWSNSLLQTLQRTGLETPASGNQYRQALDVGLAPQALAQRTSAQVTREIAQNPEWTNKISGGTLASMLANNAQNANAFTQFLGAANSANYVTGQAQQQQYNTAAILGGLGIANTIAGVHQNQQALDYYNTYVQGGQTSAPYSNPASLFTPTSQPGYGAPVMSPQGTYPAAGTQVASSYGYGNTYGSGYGSGYPNYYGYG